VITGQLGDASPEGANRWLMNKLFFQ